MGALGNNAGWCGFREPHRSGTYLAVGFHQLLERLSHTDVPIVFLAFPRFTNDPDYLFRKLRPILPI